MQEKPGVMHRKYDAWNTDSKPLTVLLTEV